MSNVMHTEGKFDDRNIWNGARDIDENSMKKLYEAVLKG